MNASREERIEDMIKTLVESAARQDEAGKNRQRMLDEHHETLFGNGKPGIKSDVQTLKDSVLAMKDFCASTHKPAGAWSRIWPQAASALLVAAVLSVLAFGFGLWRIHASELPAAQAAPTSRPAK